MHWKIMHGWTDLSSSLAAEKYFENYFNTYLPNGPEWFTQAHEYALLKAAYTQVTQPSPFFHLSEARMKYHVHYM